MSRFVISIELLLRHIYIPSARSETALALGMLFLCLSVVLLLILQNSAAVVAGVVTAESTQMPGGMTAHQATQLTQHQSFVFETEASGVPGEPDSESYAISSRHSQGQHPASTTSEYYSYGGFVTYAGGLNTSNPTAPLAPGGSCEDTGQHALIQAPGGSYAYAIYDLGQIFEITKLEAQNQHDGDDFIYVSVDGVHWQWLWSQRITRPASPCQLSTFFNYQSPPQPPRYARYIQFRVYQFILIGDRWRLAWFRWQGTPLSFPVDQALACNECPVSTCTEQVRSICRPINTLSGNYSYQATDLSISSLGETLRLERSYNSLPITGTVVYSRPLGYGWTHNYDIRLTFPNVPGGEAGKVILKAPHGSRLRFWDIGAEDEKRNGERYLPYPGVRATMTRTEVLTNTFVYTVTATDQETYIFNNNGRLITHIDPQGNRITLSYSNGVTLTRVSDPVSGRFLDFGYDVKGRLASVSDHSGRSVGYGYSLDDNLTVVTDTLGLAWTYVYTGSHLLHAVIDPEGRIVERTFYDEQGRAVRQEDGLGNASGRITFLPNGQRIVTEAGVVMTDSYSAQNLLVGQTNALSNTVNFAFDGYFNRNHSTDANGNTTRYERTRFGLTTAVTDALSNTTRLAYDARNNLTSMTDALSRTTIFTYTGQNTLQSYTDPLSGTVSYTYNSQGQVTSATDQNGRTTRYGYDAFGQRTVVTDALSSATRYGYDAVGRLITTTDSLGKMSISTYDNADRLIAVTSNYTTTSSQQNYRDTYNLVTRYGYDGYGRQVLVTDTLGRVTHNGYDAAGQLVSTTVNYSPTVGQNYLNLYNLVTRYGYDAAGNQILVTDTLGFVTRTDYDVLNRPFKVISNYKDGIFDPARPDEDIITLTGYDAAGNPITQTDALGRVTRTWYDSLNRPTSVTTNYAPGLPQNYGGEYNLVARYAYDEVGNTVLVTDTLGRATRNYYDALGRVVSTTVNYSPAFGANYLNQYNLTTWNGHDKAGNRVVMTDALGSVTRYAYDALNRVITTTDALTGTTGTVYDRLGNRVKTIDALGHTTVYTYDGANRLAATTDAAGQTTRYAYDALGNTRVVTDANGNPTFSTYDALNRLIVSTNALSGTTRYGYDALGRQTVITNANGHTTRTTYDGLGRPILTTDANGSQTVTVYDALGNRVRELNGLGHTTVYTYDTLNRLVAQADPMGNVTRYGYDALGNRVIMTDANGIVTRYGYDALNRLSTVTESVTTTLGLNPNAYNLVTRYAYDAMGNRTVITNARGYMTTFAFDALSRLIAESDALGNTARYEYDKVGNRAVMTDANSAVITYTYDAVNQLTHIAYPDSSVTFAYDKVGNRKVMTDSVGITRYTYDALYRLTTVIDPFNRPVGYAYDAAGNRTRLSYPDGKVVTYTFDAGDRLSTVQDWAGLFTRYDYDKANRLITTTLPNGVRSVNTYDAANRLLNLSHSAGTQLLSSFAYTYDKAGNRVRAVEQLRSETPAEPAFVDVPFDHWAYDYIQAIYRERYVAGCNLTPLKYCPDVPITRAEIAVVMVRAVHGPDFDPPPATGTVFEDVPASYWGAKWIEQLWNDGYIAGCSTTPRLYCPENPVLRAEMAVLMVRVVHGTAFTPPTETGTVFDDVVPGAWWSKWIEQLAADGNTQGCSANRRLYCPARPLTRAEMAIFLVRALDIPLTPQPAGPHRVYLPLVTRNSTGAGPRLITSVITYTYDPLYRLTGADYSNGKFFHYAYDPVGNRLLQQTFGVTNVYTYDVANRLTSVDGLAYTWDANGNLTGDGARLYAYDPANRLVSVADELHAYTFAYNGLGDRLRQAVDGVPVSYTLDLNAGLTQVLADGTNAYLYGAGRVGEMQPSGWAYHHGDTLASVRQLTDGGGTITLARTYQPFGSTLGSVGAAKSAYGFTGEYTDGGTRLVYLRTRYYAPSIGRFATRDIWPTDDQKPGTLNRWNYGESNPINRVDPSGQYGKEVHHDLTLIQAMIWGRLSCGGRACAYVDWIAKWIALGDLKTDECPLQLGWNCRDLSQAENVFLHFVDKPTAGRNAEAAVRLSEPFLLGAALHQVQDWYSHWNEGYRAPAGHALQSLRAGCTGAGECRRSEARIEHFYSWYPREAVISVLSLRYPAINPSQISDDKLIDLYLQEFTEPDDMERVIFGYDTDYFFGFTSRDLAMSSETVYWLITFFSQLDECVAEHLSVDYIPPSAYSVARFLQTANYHP